MPPILMLIAVAFVVLLVAFGNNPMDKIREDQAKYGKDPLIRAINKHSEEIEKGGMGFTESYTPPEGAKIYRLPPSQRIITEIPARKTRSGAVLPPPDIPMQDWGTRRRSYSPHMMAPRPGQEIIEDAPVDERGAVPYGYPSSDVVGLDQRSPRRTRGDTRSPAGSSATGR